MGYEKRWRETRVTIACDTGCYGPHGSAPWDAEGTPCPYCAEPRNRTEETVEVTQWVHTCRCGAEDIEERYCMGVYAGRYCDACWAEAGYREDAVYDWFDAGEAYDDD